MVCALPFAKTVPRRFLAFFTILTEVQPKKVTVLSLSVAKYSKTVVLLF
jgi:hypothetical protein